MFEKLRAQLLRVLRVPPEPAPPLGAAGSVRVFRAGRNFYKLRLFAWTLAQFGTLAGILISISALTALRNDLVSTNESAANRPGGQTLASEGVKDDRAEMSPGSSASKANLASAKTADPAEQSSGMVSREKAKRRNSDWKAQARNVAGHSPRWLLPLLSLAEFAGLLVYFLQIPVTYAMVRLEYESHWYIVTDRSLRIRSGLVSLQESTMSFANVQQVTVTQGPLQRILGLADVRVQSAGGGGGAERKPGQAENSMHAGVFHGVENASEIRDLILERLRLFREVGLGDPEDRSATTAFSSGMASSQATGRQTPLIANETVTAARALLAEARALRESVVRDLG